MASSYFVLHLNCDHKTKNSNFDFTKCLYCRKFPSQRVSRHERFTNVGVEELLRDRVQRSMSKKKEIVDLGGGGSGPLFKPQETLIFFQ